MRENSKDFELGVAMLPAKEQRAVPIGGASLVSFKGINEAQKKAAYQFLTYLVSPEVNGAWSRFTGCLLAAQGVIRYAGDEGLSAAGSAGGDRP